MHSIVLAIEAYRSEPTNVVVRMAWAALSVPYGNTFTCSSKSSIFSACGGKAPSRELRVMRLGDAGAEDTDIALKRA